MFRKTITTISIFLLLGVSSQAYSQSFVENVKEGFSSLFKGNSNDTVSSGKAKGKVVAMTLKDGTVYVGEMKGKRPNGQGKAIYKNGDIYEGGFLKGLRSGKGE